MKMVTLKNGTRLRGTLVLLVMSALELLMEEDPGVFVELVKKCRNPDYQLWEDVQADLVWQGFFGAEGNVHQAVRNVVLSAVQGEGLETTLGSPLANQCG